MKPKTSTQLNNKKTTYNQQPLTMVKQVARTVTTIVKKGARKIALDAQHGLILEKRTR